jgi:acyl-CoA synthetase (AMP-forming)/AMP-acid ligase II
VAEVDLTADPGASAGMFTLDLARQDESLTRHGSSRPDWAYVLTTSGTTGRPKLVPISHRQLALYAQSLSDYLSLTTNDVGCHLQPLHHAHGLNSALLVPLLKGASLVCLQEFDINGFFAALNEYQITWLTAVFTVHREILRRAPDFREAVARSRLRFLRVGSGQLKPDEIDRMERTFGAPLLMGFRMTEASSITHDPLPPRMRKRGAVGVPLCNQVAVMSAAGALCAPGDVGEVVVCGPLVFDGYFDDAQANAASFVDGWFRTGDLGRFDEEGYLYLVGRIKDLINRGGEKISPIELDAALEAIPGVQAAATFAIPHQSLGEEVVAAVVRNGDVTINASDIIDEMRRRIGPTRVPRQIYFVDQLPRTDSGKVLRSELPRLLGLNQGELTSPGSSPVEVHASIASPVEAALTGLWASALKIKHVGRNDHFLFLGGDSLRGARLISSVNAVFGVDLELESLSRGDMTVARMAREIEAIRARTAVDEPPRTARRSTGPPP